MRRKISITQKHFIYFLFLSLASIILVAYYSYYVARISILERTFNQLNSVRIEKAKNIERFFSDRLQEIELFSQSLSINNINYNPQDLQNDKGILFLSNYIKYKQYFNNIFIKVSGSDLIKINSNNSETINYINKEPFNKIQNYIITNKEINTFFIDYIENENKDYSLYLVKNLSSNSQIKYIAFELKVSEINELVYDPTQDNGLGKSGEAYIIGSDYLLRTSSRFKENSIKKIKVETKAAKDGVKNLSGTSIIKDYRNIKVLSSYSPLQINGLKWVIIAEIDLEEALTPIYSLQNSIIIICIVLSIFIFGLVYLGSTKLTNPIIELKEAAVKISSGDYSTRIKKGNNDELGELVDSFNIMSEQLKIQNEQIRHDKNIRLSAIIDAQEKERQRLSRDLHDGLGQMLLAIKMKIEQAKANTEKTKHYIIESLELIKNTISDLRAISNDLMPSVLTNFGLKDGLQKLCRDSADNSGINIEFNCDNLEKIEIESNYQIYIYRIIQEIVNNIIKHSRANNATISFNIETNKINIKVIDDGIGFDTNINYIGNGLHNISDRIELLNGKIEINSRINLGTEIEIIVPVNYEKN